MHDRRGGAPSASSGPADGHGRGRPTRLTHVFTERHDTFTLTAFSEKLAGSRVLRQPLGQAGRQGQGCGITPVVARVVKAPAFAEAELVVECRKM